MGDFNWTIWFKKLVKGLGLVLLSTGAIYTADYMNATEFPPEYAFTARLVVIILSQIGNYIKHSYLE